jgi:prophage regulatory protein
MRLIKRPEVERKTGKTCSRIYDDIRAGKFPKPVPIGAPAVAWVESEIDAWIKQRIAARDAREGK